MRLIASGGAARHAPENSLTALLCAYTGGADVLALDVRRTADGHFVLAADADMMRLAGDPAVVEASTLSALRKLNVARTFRAAGSPDAYYFDPAVEGRIMRIEPLEHVLDSLPEDAMLAVRPHGAAAAAGMAALVEAFAVRKLLARTIAIVDDAAAAAALGALQPSVPVIGAYADAVADFEAGVLAGVEIGIDAVEQDAGARVASAMRDGALGAIVRTPDGLLDKTARDRLSAHPWVWGALTVSPQHGGLRAGGVVHLKTEFAGSEVNTRNIALGYAKANRWADVHQKDGVHVVLPPYDGPLPGHSGDALERRLARIENALTYAAKDWPYYSGGGLGTVNAVRGDFVAETEYRVEQVGQATTLEMAALNVDPGAHRATPPTSFRDKDSFYDPHGAPPYVGVEHDEDDGFRINWNLGTEYDNNQYGKPVGDGARPRGARLRLERRGSIFSAYYRDAVDGEGRSIGPREWICVGAVTNESLNRSIFLRCVGKRWRQEREDDPSQYMPIIANHFTFLSLNITRYP